MRAVAEDLDRVLERFLGLALEHVDHVGGVEGSGDGWPEVDYRDRVDLGILVGQASDLAAGFEACRAAVDADDDAAEDRSADRRPGGLLAGVAFGFISDLPSLVPGATWR